MEQPDRVFQLTQDAKLYGRQMYRGDRIVFYDDPIYGTCVVGKLNPAAPGELLQAVSDGTLIEAEGEFVAPRGKNQKPSVKERLAFLRLQERPQLRLVR